MSLSIRKITHGVLIGNVQVGGGAPIVVQSMTNTDTANIPATVQQIIELADAGSELVRITVNSEEAAAAVAAFPSQSFTAIKLSRHSSMNAGAEDRETNPVTGMYSCVRHPLRQ